MLLLPRVQSTAAVATATATLCATPTLFTLIWWTLRQQQQQFNHLRAQATCLSVTGATSSFVRRAQILKMPLRAPTLLLARVIKGCDRNATWPCLALPISFWDVAFNQQKHEPSRTSSSWIKIAWNDLCMQSCLRMLSFFSLQGFMLCYYRLTGGRVLVLTISLES